MIRRSDTRPALKATRRGRAVAAAVACAVGGGALLSGCAGSSNVTPPKSAYAVRAIFDSAAFVLPGLDVKVAGVKVGSVDGVELTPENQAAVTFTITDDGFKDFRKDATCTIRPQALIGERYIECDLTQPRPDGGVAPAPLPKIPSGPYEGQHLLPVSQTAVPVDADQLLSANTPSVRERLFIIVRELGAGVAGRGDEINATLRKSNEGLRYANRILKQLANQTEMLKQLDATSDTTLASLASERASISGTISNGAVVARRLAARQAEVRASIAALNNLLTQVGPSVDKATELTDQLEPIAEDLDASSSDLATIVNDLPTVSKRAKTALTALSPTLDKGREVLTSSDTNTLIDRLAKTAAGVKTTGTMLGLTLGDFRATGGLDYLLDTIYGLAYSTNGRDAYGSYLRGSTLNATSCAIASNAKQASCGTRLNAPTAGGALPRTSSATLDPSNYQLDANGHTGTGATSATKSSTDSSDSASTQSTAAKLLFGGGR